MQRSETSNGVVPLALSLIPTIVGLAASSILAVDYLRPLPVFCSEGGGCAAVRATALAAVFGVPTPVVGLAGFAVIGAASLWPGSRGRLAQLAASSIAAVIGVALLAAQAVLRHYCIYCIAADASAIACALSAAWRFARALDAPAPPALRYAGAGAMVIAVVVPVIVGMGRSATPAVIRDEIARTPRGEVTIVDFVDFECPFCRMTHAALAPLIAAHPGRVRRVFLQVPLRVHPHAMDAARAAVCGETLGKGDAIAEALFAAPVEQLTRAGCEAIAQSVGLAPAPFRACTADPRTGARIEADRAEFKAAGGYALPTLWFDDRQLVGAQSVETLASTLNAALAHDRL